MTSLRRWGLDRRAENQIANALGQIAQLAIALAFAFLRREHLAYCCLIKSRFRTGDLHPISSPPCEDQLQIAMGRLMEFRSTQVQHFAWLNAVFPVQTKAPLAGTIYRSTGPDEPALVEVGAMVHSGSVVAIIEAQKVFYHVPAAHSGLVTEVLFQDRATVAAGDCLVQIIRPQKHEVTLDGSR